MKNKKIIKYKKRLKTWKKQAREIEMILISDKYARFARIL